MDTDIRRPRSEPARARAPAVPLTAPATDAMPTGRASASPAVAGINATAIVGDTPRMRLEAVLAAEASLAIAVSGGVDSLTLATTAGRLGGRAVTMFHAVSAAVPPAATARVRDLAAREGWRLEVIAAGELELESYVANPIDRCLHCKRALYEAIAAITRHTDAQVVSGANTDDLADFRPGLRAAAEAGVRHPFIEAGIRKAQVREIARALGLGEIADLPASPCLSSRVETGLRISYERLTRIDAAERLVREATRARDVRCRVRRAGLVIEIDREALDRLGALEREQLAEGVHALFGAVAHEGADHPERALPTFEPYRLGSAFLQPVSASS